MNLLNLQTRKFRFSLLPVIFLAKSRFLIYIGLHIKSLGRLPQRFRRIFSAFDLRTRLKIFLSDANFYRNNLMRLVCMFRYSNTLRSFLSVSLFNLSTKNHPFSLSPLLAFLLLAFFIPGANAQRTDIAGPAGSGQFGVQTVVLPSGNFVVTDPLYDECATADGGAVYLHGRMQTVMRPDAAGAN